MGNSSHIATFCPHGCKSRKKAAWNGRGMLSDTAALGKRAGDTAHPLGGFQERRRRVGLQLDGFEHVNELLLFMDVELRVDALTVRADGVLGHDELFGSARDGVPARDVLHDLRFACAQPVLLAKDLRLLGEAVGQLEIALEAASAAPSWSVRLRNGAAAEAT